MTEFEYISNINTKDCYDFKSICIKNHIEYYCQQFKIDNRYGLMLSNNKYKYNYIFNGFELDAKEPRLFLFNDDIYIIFNVKYEKQRRMCISKYNIFDPYILYVDDIDNIDNTDNTNWSPLVKDNDLYFIYSYHPLVIFKYQEYGKCTIFYKEQKDKKDEKDEKDVKEKRIIGTTNMLKFNDFNDLYLGLCQRQKNDLNISYVIIVDTSSNIWTIKYISDYIFIGDNLLNVKYTPTSLNKLNSYYIVTFHTNNKKQLKYSLTFNIDGNIKNIINNNINIEECILKNESVFVEKYIKHSNHTFVTSFIDLNDYENRMPGKQTDKYLKLGLKLIELCKDYFFIIFTNKKTYEKLSKAISPSSLNIKIYTVEMEDLPISKKLDTLYNSKKLKLPSEARSDKDTYNYLKIMNSKSYFIEKAMEYNNFNSNFFSWIDFGILHIIKDNELDLFLSYINNINNYNNNFITLPGGSTYLQKNDNNVIHNISNINKPDNTFKDSCDWTFFGGFFVGHKDSLKEFCRENNNFIDNFIAFKYITWEVNVWTYIYYTILKNIIKPFSVYTHNIEMLKIPV